MNDLGGAERVRRAMEGLEKHAHAVPGFRRAHARGVGLRGHFSATPEAAALTTAEHMQGDRVETLVRLSNGSANPYQSDRSSAKRGAVLGLAVRFELPSGGTASWASLSVKAFPARTPDDFIALTSATRRDRDAGYPNPLRLVPFLVKRPHCIRGIKEVNSQPSAQSFATARYNGMHAYVLVDSEGRPRPFRYRWIPLAGEVPVSAEEDRVLPPQYLVSEIKRRVAREPAEWDLVFQLAEPDDPTDDVTKHWPEDRPQVVAGRLVLDRVHEDQDALDEVVFDPTKVPPGIELSDDPILHFRSEAYGESFRRRSGESKPEIRAE